MEISTNTAIFGMMFIALISFVIVAYRRKEYLYIDPTGLSQRFVDGFLGCCEDMGVVTAKIAVDDATGAVVVSRRLPREPLKNGSALVTAGYEEAPDVAHHNISSNATALLRRALDHVRAVHAKSVLVVQDESRPSYNVLGNHLLVRTTPANLAGNDLIYNGVEYDTLGRPIRYWIQQQRGIGFP